MEPTHGRHAKFQESHSPLNMTCVMIYLLSLLLLTHTNAQGCANTCPPLDDGGNPVESLCIGDTLTTQTWFPYSTCHPTSAPTSIDFASLATSYDVIVVSNFYVGCNAGRREAGVFAYTSQRLHDANANVVFVSALHGNSCAAWSDKYNDFAEDTFGLTPTTMPITIEDDDYR